MNRHTAELEAGSGNSAGDLDEQKSLNLCMDRLYTFLVLEAKGALTNFFIVIAGDCLEAGV